MKKKHIPGFFYLQPLLESPALVFFGALFLCGAIAGSFTGLMSARLDDSAMLGLAQTLERSVRLPTAGDIMAMVCGTLAWQLASLACGLLRPVCLFQAALCAARGFLLSFSVASLCSVLGAQGIVVSLVAGGLSAVIGVPCLLVTATAVYCVGGDVPGHARGGYLHALGRYRGAIGGCLLLAVAAGGLRCLLAFLIGSGM